MKYFAHYGHTDFILCLGHKAEVIKEYFLNYDETLSNDFVLNGGGRQDVIAARNTSGENQYAVKLFPDFANQCKRT